MLVAGLIINLLLLLSGAPVFVAFSIGGFICLALALNIPLTTITSIFFSSMSSYPLLCIPLFILVGELMGISGIAPSIMNFSQATVGRYRGLLGTSIVGSGAIMGAITGSNLATATMLGRVMIPLLEQYDYPRSYSVGVVSMTGALATLIPPSINAVLFGMATQMSVGRLFMAGLIPGILGAVVLAIVAVLIAKRRGFGRQALHITWRERGRSLIQVTPAFFIPVMIIGCIYTGILVPTETALAACFFCVIIGIAAYRQLNVSKIIEAINRTMRATANLYLLIAAAILFGYLLTYMNIPQKFTATMLQFGAGYWSFWVVSLAIFLIVGFFLEAAVIVMVVVPIVFPAAMALHVDPYVFYILENITVSIGQLTPPVAIILYVLADVTKLPIPIVFKASIPYILGMIFVAFLVAVFPSLANFLPLHM